MPARGPTRTLCSFVVTAALLSTTWIGCGSGSTSSSAQGSAVEAGAPEADAGSPEAALGSVSDAGDGGDASTCASCLHASGDYRGQPITFACDFTMQTPTSPSHESNIDGAWAIFCFSTDGEKRLSLWFLPEQGPVDSTTGYPDGITLLLTDPLSNDHRLYRSQWELRLQGPVII